MVLRRLLQVVQPAPTISKMRQKASHVEALHLNRARFPNVAMRIQCALVSQAVQPASIVFSLQQEASRAEAHCALLPNVVFRFHQLDLGRLSVETHNGKGERQVHK